MRKGGGSSWSLESIWNLAPQGGVLAVLSLLPWLYVAYDVIGDCHSGSSAGLEMYLSRLQPFVSFEQIFNNVTSDSVTHAHSYGAFYGMYLDPLRRPQRPKARKGRNDQQVWESREVNMLFAGGLQQGDSLNLWKRAFPRGTIFATGLEKHQAEAADPRVRLMVGDQANEAFLEQVVTEISSAVGLIDFIVDDGGHTVGQQQTSLQHLLPLVKPGGIYFMKNMAPSYEAGPSESSRTTMHAMQSLLDAMNREFFEKQPYFKSMAHEKFYATPVESLVGSVHCTMDVCALRRKSKPWY